MIDEAVERERRALAARTPDRDGGARARRRPPDRRAASARPASPAGRGRGRRTGPGREGGVRAGDTGERTGRGIAARRRHALRFEPAALRESSMRAIRCRAPPAGAGGRRAPDRAAAGSTRKQRSRARTDSRRAGLPPSPAPHRAVSPERPRRGPPAAGRRRRRGAGPTPRRGGIPRSHRPRSRSRRAGQRALLGPHEAQGRVLALGQDEVVGRDRHGRTAFGSAHPQGAGGDRDVEA